MTLSYSKSLAAALRNTSAVAARRRDGSLKVGGPSRRELVFARANAVLFVITIGTVIAEWGDDASARLISVRVVRRTIVPTMAAAVIAGWVTIQNARPAVWIPALIVAFGLGVQIPHWAAALIDAVGQPRTVTHVITDVVRLQHGAAGTGALLIAALAEDTSKRIGGSAANERVWTKVYEPLAVRLAVDRKGRVRFAIRPSVSPVSS